MRVLAVAALLAGLAAAGCITTETQTTSAPPPAPQAPVQLDCSISHWGQTCLALASPNESPGKAEVDVAVNPKDPLNAFVASKDLDRKASTGCVWAVGQVTFDGGATWNTTYVGGTLAERQPGDLLYGWECITDPIMTFNKDGDLFYTLQVYRYRPGGVPDPTGLGLLPEGGMQAMAVSHDGGRTFPETILLHAGDDGAVFHDYMRTAASPTTGTVFSVWNQLSCLAVGCAASVPVLVAYEPGNSIARAPVYLPGEPPEVNLGESSITADSRGTVAVWLGGGNSGGQVWYTVSTDDGQTFARPVHAFDVTPIGEMAHREFRYGTSVEVAVDASGGERDGCLFAAWGGRELGNGTHATAPADPGDVYARRSCDGGATWTDPVRVNQGRREDGQWMARPSVDGRGTVHVVYFTRAYDPDHRLIDAEHAYSTDGGDHWTTERLTDVSFDGDLGLHQDGFPFIGDYIGIGSSGDHTYMGFPVTSTGRAEIAVAHAVAT